MNGFDGQTEQGGALDIYDIDTNSWASHMYAPDGKSGPEPRSVSALISLDIGQRPSLVTLFGERDPSTLGHQGAGKMLSDVWVLDLESKVWTKVDLGSGEDELSSANWSGEKPPARGWFAAEAFGQGIVVQGGLGESNERLGDVWLLTFSN